MLKIKRAMINDGARSPAWVEIENGGGEVDLAAYGLRVCTSMGEVINLWQGEEEESLWGSGTLRLTDGSAASIPTGLGEPRMIISLPALNLSNTIGGSLVLFWLASDGNIHNDTVTVTAGSPSGKCLYRVGNELVAPDTRGYRP